MAYFRDGDKCHLYAVLQRARLSVDRKKFYYDVVSIRIGIRVQLEEQFHTTVLEIPNQFPGTKIELEASFPFATFLLLSDTT